MNKFTSLILVFVAIVVGGCSASLNGSAQNPQPTADGRDAINPDTGKCERARASSDVSYVKCLERRVAVLQSVPMVQPQQPQPSAQAMPQSPPQAGQAGMPMMAPPTVQQAPPGYYPAAVGAECTAQKGILLEVTNNGDYDLQVYSPGDSAHQYIVPLNCDAPYSMETFPGLQRDSSIAMVMAIRPHAVAKFVFMPLNGGWGKGVRVNFRGWMKNPVTGITVQEPALSIGLATYKFDVPNLSGDRTWVSIDPSRLDPKF